MPDVETYITMVGAGHRRRFGQYFTPPAVASFMRNWVLASGIPSLYDPAFGLGAFLPDKSQSISFSASEIDPRIVNYYKKDNCSEKIKLYEEDYLLSWGRMHANIVCNPPYMRFQGFKKRKLVATLYENDLKRKLPGHANTASAFLMKSLSEMDGRGRLAYIMPFEFLGTGYGTIVKKELIKNAHLSAIIKIECEKDVFPDVTTTVCIVLYDAANKHDKVDFYSISTIDALAVFQTAKPSSSIPVSSLKPGEKWASYFNKKRITLNRDKMVPLKHYGRFSRGIATGANEFFVLSPSRARALGLLESDCRPCITKSSQIRSPYFCDKNLGQMLEADEQVLLFSINGKGSPAALEYIRFGQRQGFHERFLTRHRTPWYKTEDRLPSPLLMGVFSRGGYKIILNEARVINLTCYHGFQPDLHGLRFLPHLFLYLFSVTGRKVAALSMRTYGDSLDKFEPNDINDMPVPSPDFFEKIPTLDIIQNIDNVKTNGRINCELEHIFSSEIGLSLTNSNIPTQS